MCACLVNAHVFCVCVCVWFFADEGTFGNEGVGSKANNILVQVRGKDFTREKNKKKRSTYLCGAITMASNSYKFDN